MPMRVGLDAYSVKPLNLNALETLEYARARGLAGVQFGTAYDLSPTLDPGEIAEVAAEFRRQGCYLEVGIPCINPHRPGPQALQAGDGDQRTGTARLMRLAAQAGSPSLRCFVGGPADRHRADLAWARQLDDSTALLRDLAPLARELGVRFAPETHADATTSELIRVVEAVGADVAGLCLDTGNLSICLEEPVAAARRAAPYVIATHTKDAVLWLADDGLRWQARPCGEGLTPWPALLRALAGHAPDLTLSLEDHLGIFEMRIFDRAWLAGFPEVPAGELAAVVELAWRGQRRIERGETPDPHQVEATPWAEQVAGRLERAGRYLNRLLPILP